MSNVFCGRPRKHNLHILQGATWCAHFTWSVGTTATNVTPVDLTGCTARMHIREYLDAPEIALELTTANGRITLGGVAGTIALEVSAQDTSTINWTEGVYDLEVEFAGGKVRRFIEGEVTVSLEVTRNV